MLCKFNRHDDYLICECCGFKIKTDKDNVKNMCKGGENCQQSVFQMGLTAITSAVTAAKAGVKYIASGLQNVDENEMARRMEICTGNSSKDIPTCEFYKKDTNQCGECSCYMSWKAKMASEQCPKGKW